VPSLTQLLAAHDGLLVLDAVSTRIQVGLLRRGAAPVWRGTPGEAGEAVFALAAEVLGEAGWTPARVPAFGFGAGPGSLLGVRTVAMVLRTWLALAPRPVHAYRSLDLLAHGLVRGGETGPFEVAADARRETWHAVAVDAAGAVGPLRRVPHAELAAGGSRLLLPAEFRRWAEPPRPATEVAYDVAALLARTADVPLFADPAEPEAFAHEPPEYRRWTPQVHRAPDAAM
jgi:tRNA threonylcarbamoyladenosine biosynthesis protein TsaB